MNQREKELQELFLQNEKLTLNKLKAAYKDSLNEINSKIAILESRSDADMQNVIYQVEYQKAIKKQVEAVLDNLQNKEFETVSEYLTLSYEDGFIGTMYNLQGQNIPLVFPIDQKQVVDAIKNETKLSEDLYSAFDMKELQKQIQSEISRGIATSSGIKDIAMNISFFAKIKQNNAMRIARTEGHRIQCKASMDACEKAASKGADVVKQWDATLDKNTRESHQAVDGEIRELEDKFSNGLMYPGDPDGGASEVINCRCSLNQRARWALDREVTKWSPNAPLEIDDDGTTQYYKIPGKDYKEFKDNYFNALDRVRQSVPKIKPEASIIKAVSIPEDLVYMLRTETNFEDKEVDVECLRSINDTIEKQLRKTWDFGFKEIKVGKFSDEYEKAVFLTDYTSNNFTGKSNLYLNAKYFLGSKKEDIDNLCQKMYNSKWWKSKKLEDLVNHEIMHSRINYHNSYEKIDQMYQALKEDQRIKGFCRLVNDDPTEFMNEMYVALENGENISQVYVDVYNEYYDKYLG